MPSPVGHALGGFAVGWPLLRRRGWREGALIVLVAVAPDLDLLLGDHRGISHSLGMAVIAGVITAALWSAFAVEPLSSSPGLRQTRPRDTLRVALSAALVWASHVLFDWLSNDTLPPIGVMALWPLTRDYYKASIEIFPAVSRHYWEKRFWIYNTRALAVEIAILGPIAAAVWWRTRRAR